MTRHFRFASFLLAALLALAVTGTAVPDAQAAKKPQTCAKVYKSFYLKGPRHKAIATSGGRSIRSPGTSCGFAVGHVSRKAAIRAALATCRVTDRRYRDPGKCRIIEAK